MLWDEVKANMRCADMPLNAAAALPHLKALLDLVPLRPVPGVDGNDIEEAAKTEAASSLSALRDAAEATAAVFARVALGEPDLHYVRDTCIAGLAQLDRQAGATIAVAAANDWCDYWTCTTGLEVLAQIDPGAAQTRGTAILQRANGNVEVEKEIREILGGSSGKAACTYPEAEQAGQLLQVALHSRDEQIASQSFASITALPLGPVARAAVFGALTVAHSLALRGAGLEKLESTARRAAVLIAQNMSKSKRNPPQVARLCMAQLEDLPCV